MKITRKTATTGVIGALIVVAAATAVTTTIQHFKHAQTKNTVITSSAQRALFVAKAEQQSGQAQQAKATLKNFLATNPTSQADRYAVETQLSTVYVDQKDYNSASTYQQQAIKDKPSKRTFYDYSALGDTAAQAGNKAVAIQAYKDAIVAANANPTLDTHGEIVFSNSKIAELQGSR
jgi:predicted negative regulator of RcsB-dependent stress response